jgi:hypothetical protein
MSIKKRSNGSPSKGSEKGEDRRTSSSNLAELVLFPILGDIFKLKDFNFKLSLSGIAGIQSVEQLMPLVIANLEQSPEQRLLSKLLLKPLGMSPFQRYDMI